MTRNLLHLTNPSTQVISPSCLQSCKISNKIANLILKWQRKQCSVALILHMKFSLRGRSIRWPLAPSSHMMFQGSNLNFLLASVRAGLVILIKIGLRFYWKLYFVYCSIEQHTWVVCRYVGDILVVEVLIRIVVNHRGNYKAVISQRSVFTFLFSSFRLLVFTPTNSHFRTFA